MLSRSDLDAQSKEAMEAIAKAEEYATLAGSAKTSKERDYYHRMREKWLGIADGWRTLDNIGRA
jgi:hypothetical protein